MNDTSSTPEQPDFEHEIVLIGIDAKSYYMLHGEDYLNEVLLVDGTYPTPVLCRNFETLFDANMRLGQSVNVGQCWGIHPDIVARLRDSDSLEETNE